MRVDVLSIFPAYLDALALSLPGKAQRTGLLDLHVHDLRDWTHDRHRTVDDTPYGGGAGMVMKPEPWGEALDEVAPDGVVLLVPTPSGERFTQAMARELADEPHLVVACGRYEGIDQRVVDHAATRLRVREVSLGDYVLNGGEVAALAVLEAVVRLLPGFMGNAASLVEESHEDGLLEHPVYTKPPTWRGLDVPPVLLGGDHGAIERWRRDQSRRRTAQRRPDLLAPADLLEVGSLDEAEWRPATRADAGELWTLQRACWLQEAQAVGTLAIPPLEESLDDVVAGLASWTTWVLRSRGRLVGSVRGRLDGTAWEVGRLMVAPDLQGRGLGAWLLARCEEWAPEEATSYLLMAGGASTDNQRRYRRAGYRPRDWTPGDFVMWMSKRRR